jgi:DNA polymerase-3 subunit alpha
VIIQGKVQTDRFSGGLRLNVQQVFSLGTARCRYARFVRVLVKDQKFPVAELLREFPAKRIGAPQPDLPDTFQGLPIRVVVERTDGNVGARGDVELGEAARVYPSDQAITRFKELVPQGQVAVVYGDG